MTTKLKAAGIVLGPSAFMALERLALSTLGAFAVLADLALCAARSLEALNEPRAEASPSDLAAFRRDGVVHIRMQPAGNR